MQPSSPHVSRHASLPVVATAEPTLSRYLRELESEPLLDADQELELGHRILSLRHAYWVGLMGYVPFVPAIVARVREHVGSKATASLPICSTMEAVERYRKHRTRRNRASLQRRAEALGAEMAQWDLSCDLADSLFADIEAVESGHTELPNFDVRRPRRDSAVFDEYLANLRRARLALHHARREFAAANLRLVLSMASRWRRAGRMSFEDLVQEGNLGLMTAVDRYDPRKGFRFSTYAAWWIRHAINRALSDKGRDVRLPVHIIELQTKLNRLRREFEQKQDREPDEVELAELAGVPVDKVSRFAKVLLERQYPAADGGEGMSASEMDTIPDEAIEAEDAIDAVQLDQSLEQALDTLRPMEMDILRMRFGLDDATPKTLRQIGELYSLSRERIRQIQERALAKLRAELEESGFEEPAGLVPA